NSIGSAVRGDVVVADGHGDAAVRRKAAAADRGTAAHRASARGQADARVEDETRRGRVRVVVRRRHGVGASGLRWGGEHTGAEAATRIGFAGCGDGAAVDAHGDGAVRGEAPAAYRDAVALRA